LNGETLFIVVGGVVGPADRFYAAEDIQPVFAGGEMVIGGI